MRDFTATAHSLSCLGQQHRRQFVYNTVRSTEMTKPECPKSEARRDERVGVLGEEMFPSPPASGLWEHCKLSPTRVRGDTIQNVL